MSIWGGSLFWAYLKDAARPFKPALAVGLTSAALASAFDVSGPWLLKKGVDALQHNLNPGWLYFFSGLIVLAASIGGVFRYLMRDRVIGVSRRVETVLRDDFFNHLLHLSPSFFDRNHTGDLMTRATEDVERVRMVLGPALLYAVNTTLTILFSAIMMFALDAYLTLLVLALAPIVGVTVFFIARTLHRANLRQQEAYSEMTNLVQENLTGIRVIKAFAREEYESERFSVVAERYFRRSLEVARAQSLFMPALGLLIGLGTAGILGLGGSRIASGQATLGDFIAFMGYLSLMTWPMMALGWITHLHQRGAASHQRLQKIFAEKTQFEDTPSDAASAGQASCFSSDQRDACPTIEYRDVSLHYRANDHPVLENVHLIIPRGASVVIVGRVGSGKSTLARILTRLYTPQTGVVLLNGVRWDSLAVEELRAQIGYVDQTPFLFSATIRENITLSHPLATSADIEAAAYSAGFDEVVELFPERYETLIGERGVTLSGGQQQRLTLARALLRNPPILVLDDALSSVDADMEVEILRRLQEQERRRTTLFITHRLAAAERADMIVVLDQGSVAEVGTQAELLLKDGLYAGMFRRQRLAEELRTLA
ncbi:MAG: ABC transporter ATP-binding protein [Calditrichota bacterium]